MTIGVLVRVYFLGGVVFLWFVGFGEVGDMGVFLY